MQRILFFSFLTVLGQVQQTEPLKLASVVPLPKVKGRIDHLSIDVKGQRLFVAALGNNTVEVVDVKGSKLLHTIPGLEEPQGIAYLPKMNRLFVANGGDGSLRLFDANSFALLKTISYGDDADNVRYDASADRVFVGYGSGALGVTGPDGTKLGDIGLDAHPESFQLDPDGVRIYVNVPRTRKITVVDRKVQKVIATWTTGGPQANYPMALDGDNHRLFVVCRNPARMVVLDIATGKVVAALPVVGDSDDVFYDAARKRIYAIGGEGAITVFHQQDADHYQEIAKISTAKGARTGLFSPDLRRLFIAARRNGAEPAAIRIYNVQ